MKRFSDNSQLTSSHYLTSYVTCNWRQILVSHCIANEHIAIRYWYLTLVLSFHNHFNRLLIMPFKCCVVDCKSNYDTAGEKTTTFGFPDEVKEPDRWSRWLKFVNRKDWSPNANARICERHFPAYVHKGSNWSKREVPSNQGVETCAHYPWPGCSGESCRFSHEGSFICTAKIPA